MVDLAMIALVLVALLAVWLFLRGADSVGSRRSAGLARYRSRVAPPAPNHPTTSEAGRSEDSYGPAARGGVTHGPEAYRSMLSLRRKRAENPESD
ncbi:hypothetical protein SAMN04487820_102432 [Actinopolyspora mzabensis]|uniref:Uncharacterized protein n=1 Tax=Actinopolyspora mzabensis TaxID=995066 RepID=A0A1G8X7V5_ACTMZ|nr:hypothetical protein [Actinopolyspora mzabensis]SDJ86593.1 hypothetical protein SAMN04487820_102432 [Actinopolyspora mzabensis]